MFLSKFMISLCLILFVQNYVEASPKFVEISTPNGRIIGDKVTLDYLTPKVSLDRFRGIPYAKPPVGALRFRRPVSIANDKWSTPFRALQWPNSCVQRGLFVERYQNQNFTEDCLYLNVWSPNVRVSQRHLKPVIVWIHGGSLYYGGIAFETYNGETIAALADAVVVTINYRLATLGFLYSDEVEDIKGNQGLWDQAQALQWIQANIRHFGGDPARVTLMGESAGAWSASAHIVSPISRNLFQSAILMSGAALIKTTQSPEKFVKDFLVGIKQIGCAVEGETKISKEVVECLQKIEPEKLDDIVHIIKNKIDTHELFVIDGDFLPDRPIRMLTSGNHKKNLSLLINTNEDEGSFFISGSGHSPKFSRTPEPITLQEAKDYLVEIMASEGLQTNTVPNDTMIQMYFSELKDSDQPDLFRKQVGITYGDMYLSCPTMEFAKILYRANPSLVKVHQWYFTGKLGALKMCPQWAGACHAEDVFPYFGLAIQHPNDYLPREKEISEEVLRIVKAFIRTGSPNNPKWKAYHMSDDGKQVIAPYYEIGNNPTSDANYGVDLKQTKCNDLWNRFIYE